MSTTLIAEAARSDRLRMIARALACVFVGLSPPTQARADDMGTADIVESVWKVQSLDFAYHGYSTQYSCSALRDRLRAILHTVGARDAQIRVRSCSDLSSFAHVQITITSPVEATAENVQALTTYDSRDELIARVRNERLESAADIERFPAVWKTIALNRDNKLRLAPGDCELVQQLRRDVFPRLSIRVVRDNVRCSSVFGEIGRPRLSVAALVAVEA